MIRVLVIDDHRIFRQGVRALLRPCEDIRVVGEGRDGVDAVELTHRLQPDVVMMDIEMPRMDGLEATRRLITDAPRAKIMIVSMRMDEADVREAILSGARGYLVKNCSREELVDAIRAVHAGRVTCSPEVSPFFSVLH